MKITIKKKYLILIPIVLLLVVEIAIIYYGVSKNNNSNTTANNQIITQNNTVASTSSTMNMLDIVKCFQVSIDEEQKCLDDFMEKYMVGKTTKQTLADLETARTQSTEIENDCHPIAHAIGRLTYKIKGNIGDAFEACDQTCHSGCYHGVMERLFYSDQELTSNYKHLTYDDMKTKIPGICDKDKFKDPSNSVIFQCLHGVGHAIMYTLDYDLEGSLKSCDLLSTQYEQSSCYGGVFMENVTAFDKKKRDLKADDPLYPCDKLDSKYGADCFMMQTSIMTEYGLNNDQVAAECKKAGDFVSQCFVSMGRDLSNAVRTNNTQYVVAACEESAKGNTRSCVDGAIYALIDNTWDARFAFKLCNGLKLQEDIDQCYTDANNYLSWAYSKSREDLQASCQSYAEGMKAVCLKSF